MTETAGTYPVHRPAAVASCQTPATAAPALDPGVPLPALQAPVERSALVARVLAYPGDRWTLYRLVLSVQGPDALTDAALQKAVAILDAIEQPTMEPNP
jgi:hypothetical protein